MKLSSALIYAAILFATSNALTAQYNGFFVATSTRMTGFQKCAYALANHETSYEMDAFEAAYACGANIEFTHNEILEMISETNSSFGTYDYCEQVLGGIDTGDIETSCVARK